jgi:hypothetical protein
MTVRKWVFLFAEKPLWFKRVHGQGYGNIVALLRVELAKTRIELRKWRAGVSQT